jgi:hypothetical protein
LKVKAVLNQFVEEVKMIKEDLKQNEEYMEEMEA